MQDHRGSNIQSRPEDALLGRTTVDVKQRRWEKILAVLCVCCLWLAYFVCSIAYSIISPFFPLEVEKKGFAPIYTGVIMSCSPLCVVVLSPVFGYLLSRIGIRFMISSGLLLIGGAFVLLGFVDQLPAGWIFILFCILLRITEGVGTAMFSIAAFTILPVLYPKNVGTITGLFEVGSGLGFALGPPLGGFLYHFGGFKTPFISVGVFVLVFMLLCTLLVRSGNNSSKPNKKKISLLEITLKIFTDIPFLVLALGNILCLAALGFLSPTFQPFLSDKFTLNPLQVGLVFFIAPGIYFICALFVGPLSDRLGQRWFIVGGFVLYSLGYVFIGPADFIGSPRLWITCVASGLLGIGVAFSAIPIYSDMLMIVKKKFGNDKEDTVILTGIVSGVSSSTLSFGEFIGPLIGGGLTQVFPFSESALLFGGVILAEALLLLGITVIDKCTGNRN